MYTRAPQGGCTGCCHYNSLGCLAGIYSIVWPGITWQHGTGLHRIGLEAVAALVSTATLQHNCWIHCLLLTGQ